MPNIVVNTACIIVVVATNIPSPVATSVEYRSIDHDDSHVFVFGDAAPLVENFRVVSAESVDTFHNEYVVSFKPSQKFAIFRTVEVFTRFPVDENISDVDAEVFKSDNLPVFVSVFA